MVRQVQAFEKDVKMTKNVNKLRHYDVITTSRRNFEIKWLSFLHSSHNFLQDTFQEIFYIQRKKGEICQKNVILGDFPIFPSKSTIN